MYTTLDGMGGDSTDSKGLEGDGSDNSSSDSAINDLIDSKRGNTNKLGRNKSFLRGLESAILSKLFRINHVMLSNQAVTPIIFHIILFLSFAQILFNIFYKVIIQSEFI